MTPKEKSQELIEKHLTAYDIEPIAIKCALITVDEIMIQCWNYRDIDLETSYNYWQQVKHELEEIWEQY